MIFTIFNYNLISNNKLKIFIKDSVFLKKYSFNLILNYYYLVPKDEIENVSIFGDYESIEKPNQIVLDISNNIIEFENELNLNNLNLKKIIYKDFLVVKTKYIQQDILKKFNEYNNLFSNTQLYFTLNNLNLLFSFDIDINYIESIEEITEDEFKLFIKNQVEYYYIGYNLFAFDIECFPAKNYNFPTGYNSCISHISICYFENNKFKNFILYNNDLTSNPNFIQIKENKIFTNIPNNEFISDNHIRYFGNEKEILLKFYELYNTLQKDIVLSYNGHEFDFKFIQIRLIHHKITALDLRIEEILSKDRKIKESIDDQLNYFSIDLLNYNTKFFANELESASLDALSRKLLFFKFNEFIILENNIYKIVFKSLPTYMLDLLNTTNYLEIDEIIFKIQQILPNEILLTKYFSETKTEVIINNYKAIISKDPINLIDMYKNFNEEISLIIGLYNLQDSALLIAIYRHLSIDTQIITNTNFYLLFPNKSLKYYINTNLKGILLTYCIKYNYIYRNIKESDKDYNLVYLGAYVKEPVKKFISNYQICQDINSLYPNAIIFGNLSYETLKLVLIFKDKIMLEYYFKQLSILYPFPNYLVLKLNSELDNGLFVLTIFDRTFKGILPRILIDLVDNRKAINKKIANEIAKDYTFTNTNTYKKMHTEQNLLKLISNSLYGNLGSKFSKIKNIYIAQATTSIGRQIIVYLENSLNNAEICNKGILFYNFNINIDLPIKYKKYDLIELTEEEKNKILIYKLFVNYVDTDGFALETIPLNNYAKNFIKVSEHTILNESQNFIENIFKIMKIDKTDFNKLSNDEKDKFLKIYNKEKIAIMRLDILNIGNWLASFINNYLLLENISIKFEYIMSESIYRCAKKYQGKIYILEHPNNFDFKYSGSIEKKRSYAKVHKNFMSKVNSEIQKHLENLLEVDEVLLDKFIYQLIDEYLSILTKKEIHNIWDFAISRKLNFTYKNAENHNKLLTDNYNSLVDIRKIIKPGERYSVILLTTQLNKLYPKLPSGISNYEHIIDKDYILDTTKYRIFYEDYYKKIFKDLLRLYENTPSFNKLNFAFTKLFNEKFKN